MICGPPLFAGKDRSFKKMAKKKKRKKKAQKQKIYLAAAAAVVAAAAGSTLIYMNLPRTKLGRQLDQAVEYMLNMDYVHAEEAYQTALSIDEESERAYRGLADDYVAQGRISDAEDVLKKGYERTESEILLQNYCATVLNDVVKAINENRAGITEISRCLSVLQEDPDNAQAPEILQTCIERFWESREGSRVMLEGLGDYAAYEEIADRLLSMAEQDSAAYAQAAGSMVVPGAFEAYLSLSNRESYIGLLTRAQALGVQGADQLLACLEKQQEISDYFEPMFEAFEAGQFEKAKDFIVTETYQSIRDAFIEDTMEYWKKNTYVPVTREAIVFSASEDGWEFSFVENDGLAEPTGTIRVLGEKMKDLGVQRSSIEYVPAYDPEHFYPHTEYEIVYWNTMVSGIATDTSQAVSRMNYRFAEKIYTQSGSEANMIYDWGGANEKRKKE